MRLPAWLVDQHVLGEPVVEMWRRIAGEAGLDVVIGVDETPDADVVVDGTRILLEPVELLLVAEEGRHVAGTLFAFEDDAVHETVVVLAAPRGGLALGPCADLGEIEPVPAAQPQGIDAAGELSWADAVVSGASLARCTEQGARVVGQGDALVAASVRIEPGATIWTPCTLLGATTIAAGAVVHPGCHLTDTTVGRGAVLKPYTVCEGAVIGPDVTVGPFAHLRAGTDLRAGAKVGNFVETKATTLHAGAKANHLAYLGDAEVGPDTNVGAGTITCNYDGAAKHRTTLGAGVFVGTNSSLVAPLTVGDGALIAAGSVVTRDVPDGALVVGRAEQRTVPDKGAEILDRNRRRKAEGKA